jgi:LysM repeat protein
VAAFEHTMILTGYNQDSVQVVDAYSGKYQTYRLSAFLNSWAVLGNMAVFASLEVPNQNEAPLEAHAESYTVEPGDYLVALAKRFATTWQELAQLNSIGYPFIIHPGQELHLPAGAAQGAGSEPDPVLGEPPPTSEGVNFQAHLPLVQRDYAAQLTSSITDDPVSPEPTQPASSLGSNRQASLSERMGVDLQLQASLKNFIVPYLIHTSHLLRKK